MIDDILKSLLICLIACSMIVTEIWVDLKCRLMLFSAFIQHSIFVRWVS